MARTKLVFPEGTVETIEATRSRGTILCAGTKSGRNGMTIGWITIGNAWGRPCCAVLVRPSRYTYKFMEEGDSFTVNTLSTELQDAVDLFGDKSGRDMDKFKAAKVTPAKGLAVESPYIKEADLVIECKTAFKTPMDPKLIKSEYVTEMYEDGDYHTIYYGEIVSVHAK
jgi:flavin reductase (DIM6/NTAB) family NADH-FMN oxidoreductase RutF